MLSRSSFMKMQVWMLLLGQVMAIALSRHCIAQVVPDQTLPVGERSQVSGDLNSQINGGAIRGSNLFHSFQQFSIPIGGSAAFNNPANITNILTRVTGSNISNIDGLIRSNGTANLFLINPNGILFGANARLAIGGSFLASTANSLKFANGFEFSASNLQAPPLLTISAPIGLQYGNNIGEVRSQDAVLQVPTGQTLNLTGGNVAIEGGRLLAPGGRVELAGVAAAGEVGLTQQGQEWRLSVPDGLARADVSIGKNAIVNVRSGGSGSIAITARNFTSTRVGTRVRAGIAAGLGTIEAQAGDIEINATEVINLNGPLISNAVELGGTGNAGNINITTGTLTHTNGASVGADTFGQGNAGNVTITASDAVSFDRVSSDGRNGGAYSQVGPGAIGQGGNVSITTRTLSLTNGGVVSAATVGRGNAGNVTITAGDAVSFDGAGSNGVSSSAGSAVNPGAIGNGGNVSITTSRLSLTRGAQLVNSTFRQGNAGNITIMASEAVSFDGVGSDRFRSGAFSSVESRGIGQGGNVSITTGTLSLTNGAAVVTGTRGQGNAGNVTITARDAVSFDGGGGNRFRSAAFSSVESGAIGQGGNVSITTGTLSLTNALVTANTFGQGNAGNVTITVSDAVTLNRDSGVSSQVISGGIGNGGNVSITTGSLSLSSGAAVSADTFGQGNAGNVTITASDAVSFDGVGSNGFGSGAFSAVGSSGIGRGGTIAINTGRFSVTNRARLSTSSRGQGAAGNLEVTARQLRLDNQGSIQAQTTSGRGGDIILQVPELLLLRRGSFISTTAGTAQAGGNGGDITFNGGFIVAVPQENSNISANAFSGRGGNIRITTQGLFGIEPRSSTTTRLSSITASSQLGISGTIELNTPNIDPSRGIATLPTGITDINALIASSCVARRNRQGRFVITGTGGLVPQPDDLANSAFPTYELVSQPSTPAANSVMEADRIVRTATGEIVWFSQNSRGGH